MQLTVRVMTPPPHVLEHLPYAPIAQPYVVHLRVLQIFSVASTALGHLSAATVALLVLSMHVLVRVILPEMPSSPVHDLKRPFLPEHLVQALVFQMYVAHGFVLHRRVASGAAPAQLARATLLPSERKHEIWRRCWPPPHGSLHLYQRVVACANVGHGVLLQPRVRVVASRARPGATSW